jgi:hypothetical protein
MDGVQATMSFMTDITSVAAAIDAELESMARQVIRSHLDISNATTQSFLGHPDAREQHQTQWHQWGILTHTRVFLRHFDDDIPRYLSTWGLWPKVEMALAATVDGVSRWGLLHVSILLHDIGKFAVRTRGRERFHFSHHERLSGEIIRTELHLERFGLTSSQIGYIARTAEDHFVLGLLRKRVREEGRYDRAFIASDQFAEMSRSIRDEHPDDFVEIGVLFLGDSLAKVDPAIGPEAAVAQYDINIETAHRYLHIVLSDGTYNES